MPHARTAQLTFWPGLAISISMVLGSGILSLPILVHQSAGSASVGAWLGGIALMGAILYCLTRLDHLSADHGGIQDTIAETFGAHSGRLVGSLLVATFSTGIPGIAYITADYVSSVAGWGREAHTVVALALIWLCYLVIRLGLRVSGTVQLVITGVTVLIVSVLLCLTFLRLGAEDFAVWNAEGPVFGAASVASLGSVFFAFAGWELVTMLRRQFGGDGGGTYRAVLVVSFLVVSALYLLLVLALAVLPSGVSRESTLSLAPLADFVVGYPVAAPVYALGSLLMISSLFANILGYGHLMSQTIVQVRPTAGSGSGAIVAAVVLSTVCLATSWLVHPAQVLFQVAGAAFLLVYVIACAALVPRARRNSHRVVAAVAVLFGSVVLVSLLDELLVPVGAGLLIYLLSTRTLRRQNV